MNSLLCYSLFSLGLVAEKAAAENAQMSVGGTKLQSTKVTYERNTFERAFLLNGAIFSIASSKRGNNLQLQLF